MEDPTITHVTEEKPHRGHESTDAEVKPILIMVLGLAVFVVLIMFAMGALFQVFEITGQEPGTARPALTDAAQIPPLPRLQTEPAKDLQEIRQKEEHLLNSYEWIDRDAGVFRIPVDLAIEVLAEQGLPVRSPEGGASNE